MTGSPLRSAAASTAVPASLQQTEEGVASRGARFSRAGSRSPVRVASTTCARATTSLQTGSSAGSKTGARRLLVRGTFGGERHGVRWVSRRLLEQARRRELAQARKQIEAVPLPTSRASCSAGSTSTTGRASSGREGTATVLEQLYGLARPAAAWERDYLPARVAPYDPGDLDALAASGRLVWAAEQQGGAQARTAGVPDTRGIGSIRFFERGTASLWLRAAGTTATERRMRRRARRAADPGCAVHARSRDAHSLACIVCAMRCASLSPPVS